MLSVLTFGHYKLIFTRHASKVACTKGGPALLSKTFASPETVYASRSHPGQYRITGNGICLVGIPDDQEKTFTIITMYADRILTPPRTDQLQTIKGQIYAARYATEHSDKSSDPEWKTRMRICGGKKPDCPSFN
jgi:hypothetical protein